VTGAPGPIAGTAAGREDGDARVSPLELFFDLVMVFAITQITALIAHDHDARGVVHGVLVFAALWWAWGAYAWLTDAVSTHRFGVRLVLLGGMAAGLVAAMAVPGSFDDTGVGFGLAFLVVMALHLALFTLAAEDRATSRAAIMRLAPTNLGAALLLIVGGAIGGGAQEVLWALGVVLMYAGPYITGVAGFSIHPGYFAERHGLIVIVALGESVIAIGAGDLHLDWALAGTALLAISLVTALWWAYFDHDAERNEHALTTATDAERARLARDTYSYLHVPLVFGIVLGAVGLHDVLVHPGDDLDPLVGGLMAAGVALYFLGLVAMRLRCGTPLGPWYPGAIAVAVVVGAVAGAVPAVVSLLVLAATCLAASMLDRDQRSTADDLGTSPA
jgi:low temperature requirement protein LtrA